MICALVLAAGRSRRMGQPKLLLPLGGEPILRRVVRSLYQGAVDHVCVVTAPGGPDLAAAVGDARVQWVQNPEPEGEMLVSVRHGLRSLPAGWSAVLVTPADHPGLVPETIEALIEAHRRTACSLMVPVFDGRRGHPVWIGRQHAEAILTRFDGVGLRGLLRERGAEVLEVLCHGGVAHEDMDTPADYSRWQARLGDPGSPSGSMPRS